LTKNLFSFNGKFSDMKFFENAQVWSDGELRPLTLKVEGEKIVQIIEPGAAQKQPTDQTINVNGLWVLPGGIDLHVHISEGAESFFPGTCCAAAGGITTVLDMPPFHACITKEQLVEKAAAGEAACVVDFGLIGGIVIENSDLTHLDELSKAGAAYFKVFQPSEPQVSTDTLWKSVQTAARTGLRLGLHAEDPNYFISTLNYTDPLSFPHSRPEVAETSVVAQVIEMARAAGAPVHICHISTARTAELVSWGKSHGIDITCEIPPHFLLLNESAFSTYGARAKTTPPLRTAADNAHLWQALEAGVIDAIACDHYTENLIPALVDPLTISSAAAGIAGLELSLPLLMNAVLTGKLSLNRFVETTALTPARLAGMANKKGQVLPGMDADFTIWDLKANWKATHMEGFSRIGTTPFNDWNLLGSVSQTWVRGEQVWDGRRIQKEPGYGKWVRSEH
jgi:dihydroorotase (multifunctional complex type)